MKIHQVAAVAELWRFPVKSMRGESVQTLEMVEDGVAGDRRFAIESSQAPAGKPLLSGRERAAMLLYSARTTDHGVVVRTPGGTVFALTDPALLTDMQVRMEPGRASDRRLNLFGSRHPLTDCRPVALISQEAVFQLGEESGTAVDLRRFRANIVLSFGKQRTETGNDDDLRKGEDDLCKDGLEDKGPCFPEDRLVGRRVRVGGVELHITERDPRCRMVTLDPETAEPDPTLMKRIDRRYGGRVGVYAVVVTPGTIRIGDPVCVTC